MNTYSIKDLEQIGDVKAHTIRIWEQRYGVLNQKERARILDIMQIVS